LDRANQTAKHDATSAEFEGTSGGTSGIPKQGTGWLDLVRSKGEKRDIKLGLVTGSHMSAALLKKNLKRIKHHKITSSGF
jgi:hypothetical protein